MKSATLFSGFEGAGLGMRMAGLEHVWGLEYDPQIAAVSQAHGFDVKVLDILEADPSLFEAVNFLHASPPCPNFSVAKAPGHARGFTMTTQPPLFAVPAAHPAPAQAGLL